MKPILNEEVFRYLKSAFDSSYGALFKDDINIKKIGDIVIYIIKKLKSHFIILTESKDIHDIKKFHLSASFIKDCFENYGLLHSNEFSFIRIIHDNQKEIVIEEIATNIELYLQLQNLIIRLDKYFNISEMSLSDFIIIGDKEDTIVVKITSYSKLKPKKLCECANEKISEFTCKYCNANVIASLEYFLNYQHWYVCTNCLEKN